MRHDGVVRRHIGARERAVIALQLDIEIAGSVDFHDLPARIEGRFNSEGEEVLHHFTRAFRPQSNPRQPPSIGWIGAKGSGFSKPSNLTLLQGQTLPGPQQAM